MQPAINLVLWYNCLTFIAIDINTIKKRANAHTLSLWLKNHQQRDIGFKGIDAKGVNNSQQ